MAFIRGRRLFEAWCLLYIHIAEYFFKIGLLVCVNQEPNHLNQALDSYVIVIKVGMCQSLNELCFEYIFTKYLQGQNLESKNLIKVNFKDFLTSTL